MDLLKAGWKIFLPLILISGLGLWLLSRPSGPSAEEQIEQNFSQITQAVAQGDARSICQGLTDQGRAWTLDYSSSVNPGSCQQAVEAGLKSLTPKERQELGRVKITRIAVLGDRARVWTSPILVDEVPQPLPYELTREGWKAG